MQTETAATRNLRRGILAIGVLLPALSLVPLGSVWLWQNGLLIPWAVLACSSTLAAYAFQRWLLGPRASTMPALGESREPPEEDDEKRPLSPREANAWREVERLADSVSLTELGTRDGITSLGLTAIEAVARQIHPTVKEPLWQFTAPEALALAERVSQRMRPFIVENIPLGDRLTVAQIMKLFRWSAAIDTVEKAYDIWRVIRLVNPLTAAASEVRERLQKELYEWGRDELARRLVRAYVREVGRAAIDLYGGRLRVTSEQLSSFVSDATRQDGKAAIPGANEPLRLLVLGQTSVGKSSLVNALVKEVQAAADVVPTTDAFTAHRIAIEGVPLALIVDSPGLDMTAANFDRWLEAAFDSDLVLWLVPAVRADREADRESLARFRRHFEEHLDRRRPAIIFVATQIDRLRPFREWTPPYDLADTTNAKSVSIAAALEAIGADLGVPPAEIVPVSLNPDAAPYNLDALWARIVENVPGAQRARLVRSLAELRDGTNWRAVLKQVMGVGRVLVRTLKDR